MPDRLRAQLSFAREAVETMARNIQAAELRGLSPPAPPEPLKPLDPKPQKRRRRRRRVSDG
jgi:hypothetical protein